MLLLAGSAVLFALFRVANLWLMHLIQGTGTITGRSYYDLTYRGSLLSDRRFLEIQAKQEYHMVKVGKEMYDSFHEGQTVAIVYRTGRITHRSSVMVILGLKS